MFDVFAYCVYVRCVTFACVPFVMCYVFLFFCDGLLDVIFVFVVVSLPRSLTRPRDKTGFMARPPHQTGFVAWSLRVGVVPALLHVDSFPPQ